MIRSGTARVATSRHAWRLGPVRVVNHAIYGAAGGAVTMTVAAMALRPAELAAGMAGPSMAPLVVAATIHVLAAFALAAPWAQVFARLADLAARPRHPAPLYSIAAHVAIGIVLLRLRFLGAPDVLVLGLWLILAGLARFVDAGVRAESSMPRLRRLWQRQWPGIASLLAGIACTMLPIATVTKGFGPLTPQVLVVALVVAAIGGAATGVDVPISTRRIAGLAPAD